MSRATTPLDGRAEFCTVAHTMATLVLLTAADAIRIEPDAPGHPRARALYFGLGFRELSRDAPHDQVSDVADADDHVAFRDLGAPGHIPRIGEGRR